MVALDDFHDVRATAKDADIARGAVAVVLDHAGQIEVMGAEGAKESGLQFVKLARDHIRHPLAGIAEAVEQEEMMDEGGDVAEAGGNQGRATTDRPEGVDVGAGDKQADGGERAKGKNAGAFRNPLGAAVGRVETTMAENIM